MSDTPAPHRVWISTDLEQLWQEVGVVVAPTEADARLLLAMAVGGGRDPNSFSLFEVDTKTIGACLLRDPFAAY